MGLGWYFNEARPGDRARESQVEKFFKSDAVQNPANAVVREGIQNSLDAAENRPARVRIGLHMMADSGAAQKYFSGFFEHVDPIRGKLPNAPEPEEACSFLTFEDFGTTGLGGDPVQWWPEEGKSNPFFNFFRGEGISEKEEGKRGRHGVGKFVFAAASRARAIFGLTVRPDGRRLLMGTTVLRLHSIKPKHFLPDGWFGNRNGEKLVVPVENDPLLEEFSQDFRLTRAGEAGLSIVVPYVDQTITPESVVEAVVRGYFYPILRGELAVEVAAEGWTQPLTVDASTLSDVVTSRASLEAEMRPLLELSNWSLENHELGAFDAPQTGSPKWDIELIPEAAKQELQMALRNGERMRFRASVNVRPKSGKEQKSHFDAFFLRDSLCDDGQIVFIREGIIVSNVRPRRSAGIRGLVIIDDEPLATFLGDAENPSHTDWQKDVVKDKYVYAPATLNFVIDCIPAVIRIIGDEDEKARRPLWNDLFALSVDDPKAPKGIRKKPKVTPGDTIPPVPPIPVGKPKRYRVDKTGGGFVLRRGDPEALMPSVIEITAAYGVRKGSPFKRYRTEDFAFGKDPIKVVMAGAQELEMSENRLRVRILDPDFEVYVTGFDPNRDLEITPRVKEADDGDQI